MEDATPSSDSTLEGTLSDAGPDLDLIDELLLGDCWLDSPDCSNLLQPVTSTFTGPFDSLSFSPLFEIGNCISNPILLETDDQDDTERSVFSMDLSTDGTPIDNNLLGSQSLSLNAVSIGNTVQLGELDTFNPNSELWTNWSIQSGIDLSHFSSIKERLIRALTYIKESQRDGDVLVQIWVPVKRGDRQVLTTYGQPFSLDPNCQSLVHYRTVSTSYQFSAEVNSGEVLGLPGRVFLGKMPEWTPDVRYFSSYEYPRVNHAQRYDVRGSLALPVFERNSRSCLGVVEVVMTTQKINYSYDLENICNALEAVDLRSSEVLSVPCVKMDSDSYQDALAEILEVLRAVCETHRLPLAQTWTSCIQQGKRGSRHSEENYKDCVSTVDAACYVNDPFMLDFHEACSEHHLFRGQGIAGKAFTTNQPCFSSDITAFSKTDYPLSHHARMFNLRAALAIRLRSIHAGVADFVLEFFLPVNCIETEEQKSLFDSLWITIQQVRWSSQVITDKELEDEATLKVNELIHSDAFFKESIFEEGQRSNSGNVLTVVTPTVRVNEEVSSWIASMVDSQRKEDNTVIPGCVPLEFSKHEFDGFSVTTHWDHPEAVIPAGKIFSEFKQHHQDSDNDAIDNKDYFIGEPSFSITGKATEKKRAKMEKTVSLEVLQQYFAGSLKDAAKSIGVCPTTLKRICRQHGIARWPSRKIKKVGHSLRKLQVVIDSVQGAEGAFKLSSLYETFTNPSKLDKKILRSSTFSTLKQDDNKNSTDGHQQENAILSSHTSSSSCSQSSSSSLFCLSGGRQCTNASELVVKQEASTEETRSCILKRAHSEVELHLLTQEAPKCLTRSHSHKSLTEHHSLGIMRPLCKNRSGLLRVKAMNGEDKIRFRLQPTWGLQDLKQEIAKRFNIGNTSSIDLKYLDDESEWVLLTCDADLEECIEVYKSYHAHTIKISVHHVAHPSTMSSLGSTVF